MPFLFAAHTMPMRVMLWELAREEHPRLERALREAPDGEFVLLKLDQVETKAIHSGPIPLVHVQSTGGSNRTFARSNTLTRTILL